MGQTINQTNPYGLATLDIDRLHDVIQGRKTWNGAGHTTAMLVEALQHADFPSEETVYILGITDDWAAFLQEKFVEIARAMQYENITNIVLHETVVNGQTFRFVWPWNRPINDPEALFVDEGPFLLSCLPKNQMIGRRFDGSCS
jgi:hypothetical protein